MKRVKTADLVPPALDHAVGVAMWGPDGPPLNRLGVEVSGFGHRRVPWAPSSRWDQGGPIIERERIDISYVGYERRDSEAWAAEQEWYGPTPLIAAMRCYVASKLGEEVEIPDELL